MYSLKLAVILLFVITLQSCKQPPGWHATDISGQMPDLEFVLTGPDGEPVDAGSLHGTPVLLFFGFTSCPDVCPTTLARLSVLINQLGAGQGEIKVILVSVDPDRDTPDVMKRYTASFGPWLLGLTGHAGDLDRLRKTYGVYAAMESSDSKGTYNVMHSPVVFAFDADGRARLLMSDLDDGNAIVSDLEQLINL